MALASGAEKWGLWHGGVAGILRIGAGRPCVWNIHPLQMRSPLLLLALFALSACSDNDAPATPEASGDESPVVVAGSVAAVCDLLNSAVTAPVEGMDRYAAPEVIEELTLGGAGYNSPLVAEGDACITGAGDANVIFTVADRGDAGFYATGVTSQLVGENAARSDTPEAPAPQAASRTVADVCNGLRPIFTMGDGMAWRELDTFATMEVLSELRGIEDPGAIISAEGTTCVISADGLGDAELVLTVGNGPEGLMALSSEARLVGEAAYYSASGALLNGDGAALHSGRRHRRVRARAQKARPRQRPLAPGGYACTFSNTAEAPMPPPMHIVTMP